VCTRIGESERKPSDSQQVDLAPQEAQLFLEAAESASRQGSKNYYNGQLIVAQGDHRVDATCPE
jgi:hypothetical protein